ncbi:RNA polymerase sigma factor [Pilimelia anulata]|uniref:RNA polymerase sigma factor n=1 Tax=Pilimelia anulata TaxID=53371 RepID=A0A8J3BHB0_9ACTN|nr:SigE family RNA polymerase sigma factor [Pilimelia anulata]GGK09820.1 RNA polymerase sigma factor [Pilimelia anulata]
MGGTGQFAGYVRVRHPELLRFALALSGSRYTAEDLVQEALERAALRWRKIEGDDPEGYIRRIIVNQNLNLLRSRRRERLVGEAPEPSTDGAESPHDEALERALSSLPRRQRAAVVLRYYLDQSDEQISDLLGISASSVRSSISRALLKMRSSVTTTSPSEAVLDVH